MKAWLFAFALTASVCAEAPLWAVGPWHVGQSRAETRVEVGVWPFAWFYNGEFDEFWGVESQGIVFCQSSDLRHAGRVLLRGGDTSEQVLDMLGDPDSKEAWMPCADSGYSVWNYRRGGLDLKLVMANSVSRVVGFTLEVPDYTGLVKAEFEKFRQK